jgi:hypothetical protein
LSSCDSWQDNVNPNDENADKLLDEVIRQHSEISVFASILQTVGYDRFLNETHALTVFAPTNDVLTGLDMTGIDTLEWVKNYIAYYSYYTDNKGDFGVSSIEMINGKSIPVSTKTVSGANIQVANLQSSNGVLHIIDNVIADRKSVWEYMQEQQGFVQVDFITSFNEKVMDMERSIPVGVNEKGQQVYDTVWIDRNVFLETYPLADERKTFTVILLDNEVLDQLKTKYNKYFAQQDTVARERTVLQQISSDLILKKQEINTAGRYLSFDDVLVDLDPVAITESYQCSNGWVYKMSAADVKMYNNKIKELFIEAENYHSRFDGANSDPALDYWMIRNRSWVSNGQDMVLMGRTYNTVEWSYFDEASNSTITGTNTYSFIYLQRQNKYCSNTNAYLEFKPVLYSTDYNIYWAARPLNSELDVLSGEPSGNGADTIVPNMTLEQKLLVSFPGEPVLTRSSGGVITNNFTAYSVMAGTSVAGTNEETKLTRYRANVLNDGIFLLGDPYATEDKFGLGERLKSPSYGTATFFVANSTRGTYGSSGMLYLDYIRIVPLVDSND